MGRNASTNDIATLTGLELASMVGGGFDVQAPGSVFGYSQSATVVAMEQPVGPSNPVDVQFVLTGNEMNPNGGLLTRFPGLTIPVLDIGWHNATP